MRTTGYNDNWQVAEEYDSGGTVKRESLYGNYIDEVLYSWGASPSDPRTYYVHDHLYSPVALVNYAGTVVERYEAACPDMFLVGNAYGEPNILDGSYNPRSPQASTCDNSYMFTGRQVDILDGGALKIQYNRNRYYGYYTGRWTTQDPLGITPNVGPRDMLLPLAQYVGTASLFQYLQSNPTAGADPLGLWGPEVHAHRTCTWASEVGMCFAWNIGGWANTPDTDYRSPVSGSIAGLSHLVSITRFLDAIRHFRDPLGETPSGIGADALTLIAYWHFPGADIGEPVEPGGLAAHREVKLGIRLCNLRIFSEGLHQLQDSYSHQSGGRLPPVYDLVAHSRDSTGFYWENWESVSLPGVVSAVVSRLSAEHQAWARQMWRKYAVATSHEADNIQLFKRDLDATEVDTKGAMDEFMRRCCCIKSGPFTGHRSRCRDR